MLTSLQSFLSAHLAMDHGVYRDVNEVVGAVADVISWLPYYLKW